MNQENNNLNNNVNLNNTPNLESNSPIETFDETFDTNSQTQPTQTQVPQNPQIIQNNIVPTIQNGGIIAPTKPVNNIIDSTQIGFIQQGAPLKKKKNPILIGSIITIIIATIGLISYFFIYPFIIFHFFSNPKNVYKKTIDIIANEMTLKTNNIIKDKGILEGNISFDTDIQELKNYIGYTYSGRIGFDPKEQLYEIGYNIKDIKKNDVGQTYYIKNNTNYISYTTYNDLIYMGNNANTQELFDSLNELFNNTNKITNEEANYLITAIQREIKNSIDDTKLSKENASITVNGEALKVLKHNYTMDKETILGTIDFIKKNLSKDEKFVEIYAKLNNLTNENAIHAILGEAYTYEENGITITIPEKEKLELDDDIQIVISIYTYGNNLDFVGCSLESNIDSKAHFYIKDGNFEYKYIDKTNTINVIGKKLSDKTNVTVTQNDKKIADLIIYKFNDNEINFDYSIILSENGEDNTFTGNFNLNKNGTDENANYETNLKINLPNKTYLTLNAKLNYDWTSEVADVNTSSAVTLNDSDFNNIIYNYNNELMKTPIGTFFSTISGLSSSSVIDYYNQSNT